MSLHKDESSSQGRYPIISVGMLPSGQTVIFKDSSFFTRNAPNTTLPSPAEIFAKCAVQQPSFKMGHRSPRPVRFETLGLIVKFGRWPRVTIAEGQCLWALRQVLPQVPVPEIYGWTEDSGYVFLFMELVPGVTLEERWESLRRAERISVCEQLRVLLSELRKVQRSPDDLFLGNC
jgi:hypothetical protein